MPEGILVNYMNRLSSEADHGRALFKKDSVTAPREHSPHPTSVVRGQHLTCGSSKCSAQGRGQPEVTGIDKGFGCPFSKQRVKNKERE